MTSAREYLRDIHAVVINVPSSTERLQQFMRSTAPLFAGVTVHSASPVTQAREEAYGWRQKVRAGHDSDIDSRFKNVKVFLAQDKTLEREAKQLEYAKTYSLYRTTKALLERFLDSNLERIIVLEDDAVPRAMDLMTLEMSVEQHQKFELSVWGGAIGMGAHKHDDEVYRNGKDPAWKPITSPNGKYIATAYEVTRQGAAQFLYDLRVHPHAVDCSWWYTMAAVPSQVLSPTGFVQWGQSDRINSFKEGAYSR
uniref:Glycosyltransferase n=1 Tax=Micrococcus phage Kurnik TaxID=3092208 RepID=A0AAU6R6B6_9CAUD